MLSKNKIKLITSLNQKKYRDDASLFVAEGTKLVTDLAQTFTCVTLVATTEWLNNNQTILCNELIETSEVDLFRISNQKSPQGVLAVFRKPEYDFRNVEYSARLCLALDDVQDPGNLGTIIRIADWFGIQDLFCSVGTADAFSPKTVQATMGALARVRVHYVQLPDFLKMASAKVPVYGTFMDGDNIYNESLTAAGIIVMGNEGNGVSSAVKEHVTHKLLIPNYPAGEVTSESLNVGVATALVCAEFRRRLL